jgi:hypothetical protein
LADHGRLPQALHGFAEQPAEENKQNDLQQEQRFGWRLFALRAECGYGQKNEGADQRAAGQSYAGRAFVDRRAHVDSAPLAFASLSAQILTLFDRANCQTRRPVAIQRTAALEVPWNDWQKERAEIADQG